MKARSSRAAAALSWRPCSARWASTFSCFCASSFHARCTNRRPASRSVIPSDFGFGVDTKFQNQYRIWVVRNTEGIFVISAICTHLGCTPDWKPSENKFKCPCHGSGYDPEGINFEGPAPRPMDRAHVELAPDGQIEVDLSHLYSWPKGERSQFGDPGAILRA